LALSQLGPGGAVQPFAVPPQAPPLHESAVVQRLPSSQVVPLVTAGCAHRPLWQTSLVQTLLSLEHAVPLVCSVMVQPPVPSQVLADWHSAGVHV
jgi:hypothetical protein